MIQIPEEKIPITHIPLHRPEISLYLKREDLIHPEISGNKFWKLLHNINFYLRKNNKTRMLITFGGAYSNHIFAVSEVGKKLQIPTLGIIRGEELKDKIFENPTLKAAYKNQMNFHFVNRTAFRDKTKLEKELQILYPEALIIPEGGTNDLAVNGIQGMLTNETKNFDYLCIAVGTGGSVAGLSKFCEKHAKVLGFLVVNDASLEEKVFQLSGKRNYELIEAYDGGYGKISESNVDFINSFYSKFKIPLDPIYTGKMMRKIFQLIEDGFFPNGSRILAFHTGGLQGIEGANKMLQNANREIISFKD